MNLRVLNKQPVAVIVAHPDDETLWAGGTILNHKSWDWFIVCLCRGGDKERSLRYFNALRVLNSKGIIADLDDGPEQNPLDKKEVEQTILNMLPAKHFDLIITHNPTGEYTRHLRHEEVSKAVINLWYECKISVNELWTFAYEDGKKEYYPRPIRNSPIYRELTKRTWSRKYDIITKIYGFGKNSFEAETTPRAESFWQFTEKDKAKEWLDKFESLTI
jgi:LmbE family N-acetylglucosaminyl deacetylase